MGVFVSDFELPHYQRSETCTCHGEFTSRMWLSNEGKSYPWTTCPQCSDDTGDAEAQLENQRHRDAIIAQRLEKAGIPVRFRTKTLDNFEVADDDHRTALAVAQEYVADFAANHKAGRCLGLCGPTGRGKTHVACGIARSVAASGFKVLYTTARDLIRSLRDTWRRDSPITEVELLSQLRDLDLLVLDEVGVQFGTDAEKVQLLDVIDARYGAGRPTIVVTNLNLAGLRESLGERVLDRLRENGGRMLVFKGKSWRAK